MKHASHRMIVPLLLACCLGTALYGQNPLIPASGEDPAKNDTIEAPVLPFEVPNISQQSMETMNLVQKAGANRITEEEAAAMQATLDTMFVVIDTFLADTLFISFRDFTTRDFENTDNRANVYLNNISLERDKLEKRYDGLEQDYASLEALKKRWLLTREQSAGTEIPEALLGRIDMTLRSIDSVGAILQSDIGKILLQHDRLLDRKGKLEALKDNVQNARLSLSETMFRRDAPVIFREFSRLKDPDLFSSHLREIRKSLETDLALFRSEFSGATRFIIFLFIALVIFFLWFRKNYTKVISSGKIELTPLQQRLIQSPVLVALFTGGIIVRFAFPEIPFTMKVTNVLVLVIPLVILSIRFLGNEVRSWVYWLIAIYSLSLIYELVYAADILQRILLLVLSASGLVMYAWMILNRKASRLFKSNKVYSLVRKTGIFFAVLLLAAIILNVIGAFSLAEFLTLIPIQITFLVLAVKIVTRFVDLLLYVALASNFLLRVNAISEYFDLIHEKISRVVNLFFWFFFVARVMQLLRIKALVFEWGKNFFTTGRMIGEVEISLRSIVIFVFVIWLSLFISKIVRYILEKDVFERVTVSKGVPGTVVMLVRIALITGGFLLAAAAAGMELTNLSIVLGAFSVGIGFGLQNIFNNMVSGLILAFERPINVGDTVQVGELMGNVLNIGLRASRIKSFDGAEVIVPNGNLISDLVINWTLSDAYRRMDIRVGVAYGTDPKLVTKIIREVADEHQLVKKEPPPRSFFIGFGDSSLDFRLLAWVNIEDRLDVESELHTTINEKLKEAGIEIPFPQRDLHIRSDATKPDPAQG